MMLLSLRAARRCPAAATAAARLASPAANARTAPGLLPPAFSTQPSIPEEPGPGPGPRARSMEQAAAHNETSTTSGTGESSPPRSPDAPADPANLAANRGSDPQEVLRTSAWQAQQAMSSSIDRSASEESLGGAFMHQAPHMAGRLVEKVASAAGIAAQAVTGAASAMSDTVKAATGAATGGAGHSSQVGGRPADPDRSPVSDDGVRFGDQVPDTNSDTARAGEVDTATGTATEEMLQLKTEQGGYRQAAEKLMDIEGLSRDSVGPRGDQRS